MEADTDGPIFKASRHDLPASKHVPRLVQVAGKVLVAAAGERHILVAFLDTGNHQSAEIPSSCAGRIQFIHLAPNGAHLLVSMSEGDILHVFPKKLKLMTVLRKPKAVVSAVGWCEDFVRDTETGPVLLGTTKGALWEVAFSSGSDGIFYTKEHVPATGVNSQPIAAISLFKPDEEEPDHWALVICTSSGRLSVSLADFQAASVIPTAPQQQSLVGSMFIPYMTADAAAQQPGFYATLLTKKDVHVIPSPGDAGSCATFLVAKCSTIGRDAAAALRWIRVDGTSWTVGDVDRGAKNASELLQERQSTDHIRREGRLEKPDAAVLTNWHAILGYRDRLKAVCLHSRNVVFEKVWRNSSAENATNSPTCQLSWDSSTKLVWAHSLSDPTGMLKLRSNDETRFVWRHLLEAGQFSRALAVAQNRETIDAAAKQLVVRRWADSYLEDKKFEAAAEVLSQSTDPFETIVLKFLGPTTSSDAKETASRRAGLKTLLDKKLAQLKSAINPTNEDKMRCEALVLWLLNVQLSEMADARRAADQMITTGDAKQRASAQDSLNQLRSHFEKFLMQTAVKEALGLHTTAAYRSATNHADFDAKLAIARMLNDQKTAVQVHLLQGQTRNALDLVFQQGNERLLYETAKELSKTAPKEFFEKLARKGNVQLREMLDTVMTCVNDDDPQTAESALRFVELQVEKDVAPRSFHNLLVVVYARQDPPKLLAYIRSRLERQKRGSEDEDGAVRLPFDVHAAIRVCRDRDLHEHLAHLYSLAGQHVEAVEAGLKVSVKTAEWCAYRMESTLNTCDFSSGSVAGEDDDDDENDGNASMRRAVWLRIARHLLQTDADPSGCLRLMEKSRGALRLRHLLPHFPDFTRIDVLRQPLCDELKRQSGKIADVQNAMRGAVAAANEARARTAKLKNRAVVIRASETCRLCSEPLISKNLGPFVAFACRHHAHRSCLIERTAERRTEEEEAALRKLLEDERALLDLRKTDTSEQISSRLVEMSAAISTFVAAECFLCGPRAIESVDKPLLTKEQRRDAQDFWRL